MEKEIRKIELGAPEVRKADDGSVSRTIEGYALVFDSWSEDLGGFRERILPEAMGDVISRSDVFALCDHDYSKKLARCRYGAGSLQLTVDERGLKYSFEAPFTDAGNEVLEAVRRKDMTGSSFAFTIAEDEWRKADDGTYERTIKAFDRLYDISPVYEPAYQGTEVKCARYAEVQEEERAENERKMKEAEEQRKAELEEYFKDIKSKIEEL